MILYIWSGVKWYSESTYLSCDVKQIAAFRAIVKNLSIRLVKPVQLMCGGGSSKSTISRRVPGAVKTSTMSSTVSIQGLGHRVLNFKIE